MIDILQLYIGSEDRLLLSWELRLIFAEPGSLAYRLHYTFYKKKDTTHLVLTVYAK